jgi:hypothetical protein
MLLYFAKAQLVFISFAQRSILLAPQGKGFFTKAQLVFVSFAQRIN